MEAAKERERLATEKVQEELRRYGQHDRRSVWGLFPFSFQPDLALAPLPPCVSR